MEFDYLGKSKTLHILRDEISDPNLIKLLSRKGGAGAKDSYRYLVDTLLQQEEDFEANGSDVTPVYENLGWINLPEYDNDGKLLGYRQCFRANELLGHCDATYIGSFDVAPYGSYKVWKKMIIEEIIPTPVLQLVIVAALSAVVLGLIAPYRSCENPIIHLCYASGKGKTTALECAASTAGKVFDGEHYEIDEYGQPVVKHSVFQSWSSTDNAMITRQAGNRGIVTVLNELGKSMSNNMTRLIFDLSEGSDKVRLSKDLRLRVSEGYSTVFISCGESSLLDRCKSKYEGLRIRVMEINKPITTSPKQARRIKITCRENGGFAAAMLAQYIIDQGGANYVLPIYDRWMDDLQNVMTSTNSKERFIEKFAALFMATAEIATDALRIPFDIEGLQNFLVEYDREADDGRNTSADSYEVILSQCRINLHRFYVKYDRSLKSHPTSYDQPNVPKAECWGRVTYMSKLWSDSKVIVEEFEVRKEIVEKILRENGFQNKSTCEEAWKAAKVLDYEGPGHPCRKRKIDPTAPEGSKERVYVFRVFCDPADLDKHWVAVVDGQAAWQKKQMQILPPNLVFFS